MIALRRWAGALAISLLCSLPVRAEILACGDSPRDASRIAVAGGSLVEILDALGEYSRIVAVDRTATFPAAAKSLPQIGYVRDLSAEGLLSLQPTLVLGEHDMGPPEVIEQLAALDVDVLIVPESFTLAGIEDKVRCVAAAVDRSKEGEALIAVLSDAATGTAQGAPAADIATAGSHRGMVLLGVNSGSPLAAGADTSGAGLLGLAGATNAMDFVGWKPVSAEAMAVARPDFIVITERGVAMAGGLEALLAHPALQLTPAVQQQRVLVMDGMAMLGFGPRTVEAAEQLRQFLADPEIADGGVRP